MAYKYNPLLKVGFDEVGAGGSASAAGSDTQIQYNNSGAFGASADLTWDDTAKELGVGGSITLSLAGAASTPPLALTGTWFSGGTTTTTKPQLLIEPNGTTSTEWSTNGTGLGVNAPSGFTGNLLDLQNNGTSLLSCYGATAPSLLFKHGAAISGLQISPQSAGHSLIRSGSNAYAYGIYADNFKLQSSLSITWASGQVHNSSNDTGLVRSAASVVKVTNGSTGDGTLSAQLRAVGTAPASTGATGTAGDIRYDADYIYVCTATNTWKRAALATW